MRARENAGSLSRRKLVGYGAAALCASPLARAQTIAPPVPGAPPDDAARIAAGHDSAKRMTVPVLINGKGPFQFVVDTGADRSVIADDVAVRLGLVRGDLVTVQGVVRTVSSRLVAVADITVGSIERRNLVLPLLPRSLMGADGYLGLDAVDGARVTLDFKNQELLVGRPGIRSYYRVVRPSEAMVPVSGQEGHLRSLNCRVDGVLTTCFLDTGAEISVGNTQLFTALLERNPDYQVLGMLPITGITGGVVMGKVVQLGTIRLHSVTFNNAAVAIADMQIFDVWQLNDQPALLIGMNWLRQFERVSIDYRLKEINFNLASVLVARAG